uniref:response regulator n=1 Tax=Paractinoplanes polyasparticus TaxID=2856853 RepID=UPI002105EC58|nr:response regulator [Actinoplanes polyasparticus]
MTTDLILVADDDSDIRDLLTVTLESAGFRAVAAKDGHTAARILTVAKPAGLITDVQMPALNGLELCRRARLDPAGRTMAIVVMSANIHAYAVEAGLDAGRRPLPDETTGPPPPGGRDARTPDHTLTELLRSRELPAVR